MAKHNATNERIKREYLHYLKEAKRRGEASITAAVTPGRYVGAEDVESDDEPIEEKIERLKVELFAEFDRGQDLEDELRARLRGLRK